MLRRSRLLRSTLGLSLARGLSGLMLVLATIVLARGQGAATLGLFGLALTVGLYATVLADSGLPQYLLPRLATTPRDDWKSVWADVVRFQYRSALPFSLVFAACVVALSHGAERTALLAVLPWWLLLRVNGAARSVFIVAERVTFEAAATIAETAATLVTLTLVAFTSGSPALAVLMLSVGATLGLAVRTVGLRRLGVFGGRASTHARDLLRAALPFNGYSVLTSLYLRIDIFILSALATPVALGLYQPPIRFVTALLILPDALASLLLGRAAREPDDERVRARQEQLLAVGVPLGCLLVVIVALLGRPALALLYGARFRDAALALTLMTAIVPVSLVSYMNGTALTARGRQRARVLCLAATAVAAVALGIPAIWLWSYTGAAAVSLLNEVLLATSYALALGLAAGRRAVLLPRPHRLRLA
jgi:O-antigen/teichoic acid export membrane protein